MSLNFEIEEAKNSGYNVKVTIIIVNYNTADHLKDCLKSIIEFTKQIDYEIIVADNNSTIRDIENFPAMFPNVRFIFRNVNDGFGAGCNCAAKFAKGKYLIFVNPDIVIVDDVIHKLCSFMEENIELGACSPLLMDFEDNIAYNFNEFPNLIWEFFEASGIGNARKLNRLYDFGNYKAEIYKFVYVDWITGAFLLVRADAFNALNGFDERYFLYYEDTDFQNRLQSAGFKIACLYGLIVRHFGNSSVKSEKGEEVYFYHLNRSKMIYSYLHFGFLKRSMISVVV